MDLNSSTLRDKALNGIIGISLGVIVALGGWVTNNVSRHAEAIAAMTARQSHLEQRLDRIDNKLDILLDKVRK